MYRLWLEKNEPWYSVVTMSLNQVDLCCLALDAWSAATGKGKD